MFEKVNNDPLRGMEIGVLRLQNRGITVTYNRARDRCK